MVLTMTACNKECKPKVEYVKVPYEVKVPVKCHVPEVECKFDKETDTEVLGAMMECIVDLKRASKVCE